MSRYLFKPSYNYFVIAGLIFNLPVSYAQTLEEVVVTAQRRTQSLQDVPISIDVISGDTIDRQGYSFLRDMADFTPGLIIKNKFEEQGLMIRGNGNTGKNLSIEQAAPIFVDGVHFGLASQTMNAFLDAARVEVLKGPQPVYFGQSAIAGAISITSRMPGPVWEGRAVLEYANNNTQKIEFGIGGPVTDTLGIRLAGKLKQTDGYMEDIFTGERFPFEQEKGVRGIVQWQPSENFETTFKLEFAKQDMGSRSVSLACKDLNEHPLDTTSASSALYTGLAGYSFNPVDCSTEDIGDFGELGIKSGPLYIGPTDQFLTANNNPRGVVDMTQLQPGDLGPSDDPLFFGNPPDEFINADFREVYESAPWNGMLNISYTMNNGIELTALTGYSRQVYQTIREPQAPMLSDIRRWHTDYNSWSQELRLTSPAGMPVEWMAGVYWQKIDAEYAADGWRAEPLTAFRGSRTSEDNEWRSAFGAVTYNFFDNHASIDIGARYEDIHKEGISYVHEGDWIVEDPVTGDPIVTPRANIIPLGLHGAVAVGRTPLRLVRTPQDEIDHSEFSPQVVLRYRPGDEISLYGKWARGFKSGAFEVGGAQPPADRFKFDAEKATTWEAGARGTFLDGRANANLTLFWTNYKDLQVTSVVTIGDFTGFRTANAARQRSRGAELSGRFLLNDRTSLGYSAMLLDSVMVDFPNATCQQSERDRGLCRPDNTIDRSGEPSIHAPDWQVSMQLDHWMPVMERYKASFNAKFVASDEYITDRNWSRVTTMHASEDMNLSAGFGDREDVWQVSVFARNILEKRPTYNPEHDIDGDGQLGEPLNSSNFMSYGLQLRYNYN